MYTQYTEERARRDWEREREGRRERQRRWGPKSDWEFTLRVYVESQLGYWSNSTQLRQFAQLFGNEEVDYKGRVW